MTSNSKDLAVALSEMQRRGLELPVISTATIAESLADVWTPNPGPQTMFVESDVYEVLYGGAAGGGKSVGLLAVASEALAHNDYHAIIFRKTYKHLTEAGGLVPRSKELYPALGGKFTKFEMRWYFPSGSTITFRHLQREADRDIYQGAEYIFIGFDELSQFKENTYLYLFSRARSRVKELLPRVRLTANPGAQWVLQRWLPWLGTDDELFEAKLPRAQPGEPLWFARDETSDREYLVDADHPDGLSRTFIPATVYDNPVLMQNDPGYIRRLKALPKIDRLRLLHGDWHVMASAGTVYEREWFGDGIIKRDIVPLKKMVRAFDIAATEKEVASDDPDFTATVAGGQDRDGNVWVLDVEQKRMTPLKIDKYILSYHESEPRNITYVFEQEPGSAGKIMAHKYRQLCRGRRVKIIKPITDKVTRAGPSSSDLEGGLVRILKATWNPTFIAHLVNFPSDEWHDDIVDAFVMMHQIAVKKGDGFDVREIDI